MTRRALLLTALALLASAQATMAGPQPIEPTRPAVSRASEDRVSAWFIELKGAPRSLGGAALRLATERQAFRDGARALGVPMKVRYTYDTLFNGFSVEVGGAGLAKLAKMPNVKAVYPVFAAELPEPVGNGAGEEIDLVTSLAMVQGDTAQSGLGLTGQGVLVAIMDTGIDIDHPDLGGCFGPGCRIAMGYDFVGDAYNNDNTSPSYNPVPTPDPVPDDCNGHGSHVAGIIGANGAIKGMAPGVTYAAYRVFGCQGSTSSDIMVAAMERVYNDGAKILNMSIGSSFQWPQYPTAAAADRLVERGVVVVTSAGNSGANGAYAVSAPGVGEKVIATASFDNTHLNLPVFTLSPDNLAIAYNQATGALPAPLSGSSPMARTGTSATTNDACNAVAPPAGSLLGKVALIRRGFCTFNEKVANAQNAGAIGVVIYNNVAGIQNITVVGPAAVTVPVVSVSQASGVIINNRLASGPVTMTWTTQILSSPNTTGNLISTFSSIGVSPILSLKPDIGAPGGSIRSTYPLELGGYASISGTSMASPHVAGAAALLLEAHPGTTPADVRSILQNYAEPQLFNLSPSSGFRDATHKQGAGILQIADAITGTVHVTPGKLSLGETQAGPITRTLTVKNDGSSAVTFTPSHEPAMATLGTFTPAYFNAPATVSWSAASLTVPAGGTGTINVTISPNTGLADKALFGGYLVLTPASGREVRVPYSGFKGDYQSIQAIVPTANNFPWLAKLVGTSFFNQPAGATYTLQGGDIPYFLIHFDHQVQRLEFEIRDAATGQPVHPVFHNFEEDDYLPRNSTATSFFSFFWDGTRIYNNGNQKTKVVPDGQYVIVVKALKALGDANDPAHWETWTSPVVTLDRP
ncbi:MAG TPA: S8 family serine peptidase [Thermoanaerobaculia bacterium]|nr:S8 family serine peptidase [Thermoanaerobaculia bacterium]